MSYRQVTMPFKSDAQRREMFANQPEIARKWVADAKAKGEPVTMSDMDKKPKEGSAEEEKSESPAEERSEQASGKGDSDDRKLPPRKPAPGKGKKLSALIAERWKR